MARSTHCRLATYVPPPLPLPILRRPRRIYVYSEFRHWIHRRLRRIRRFSDIYHHEYPAIVESPMPVQDTHLELRSQAGVFRDVLFPDTIFWTNPMVGNLPNAQRDGIWGG